MDNNTAGIDLVLDLSVEQEFQLRLIETQVHELSSQQMKTLLLEATRLLMLKDNVIRSLVKKVL
jgi:hypothetical protein